MLPLALCLARTRPTFAATSTAASTATSSAGSLNPHVRRLDLERLAAVELDRVAPGRAVWSAHRVEVGGDAALAVHVRPACAVDLHPLVHEGGVLRV